MLDTWGSTFEAWFEFYEKNNLVRKVVNARDLWFKIIYSQIETGTPYMVYKDACNRKSNQKNLGTIQGSNLCTEIIEYTSKDEIAVCNLASISLPMFIKYGILDVDHLIQIAYNITLNLNKVIDVNYYPLIEAKNSNLRHRPIGIGVQGLADLFLKLRLPFDSDGAKSLNSLIFQCIYYGSLRASCDLSKIHGPYESFAGSPTSQGILQYDFWDVKPCPRLEPLFSVLRLDIMRHGLRNSLLIAPMPTASTSQILGNNECFEPFTSNIYIRRVMAGEFMMVNKHLISDLVELKIWNADLKNELISHKGSIQNIKNIPDFIKLLYRTVWELKMKDLVDMAADRGAFICQSQSFNCFMATPTKAKLTSFHFYGWKKGLKTGMYYFRTLPAVDAIQFTVTPEKPVYKKEEVSFEMCFPKEEPMEGVDQVCRMEEGCLMCSG